MTATTRAFSWLLSLAALVLFAVLLARSLTGEQMLGLFASVSYYLILLLMLFWVVKAVAFLREADFSVPGFLRTHWAGIVLSLVLTIAVLASVKVGFKTLADETNLLSVSASMVRDRTVLNCTMAKFYYGNLHPIIREVDKRSLVFPFLVSVLHTATGFRPQNAFALNFVVLFAFLTGVYVATRKLLDAGTAAAAVLFVLSYPVVTIFATSGGFDLLNAAFFFLVLAITYGFIKSPTSAGFAFLYASLLVFANIRYESVVFLPLILLLVAPRIRWQHLKDSSLLLCITPLVFLPFVWIRLLKPGAYYEGEQGVQLFSPGALWANVRDFFSSLIDLQYVLPYAGLVTIVGIVIILYLFVQTLRGEAFAERAQRHFLAIVVLATAVSTIIYFAHFMGRYTHPSSARFFITLSLVFALSPVALRVANPRLISGPALLGAAIVCFALYHPIAVEGRFINALLLNRQTNTCMEFLREHGDRNVLVISARPGQYVAIGHGAVDFAYANLNKDALLNEARRHLYSQIIVCQEILYDTGAATADTALDAAFALAPAEEIQVSATSFLRISRVAVNEKPR